MLKHLLEICSFYIHVFNIILMFLILQIVTKPLVCRNYLCDGTEAFELDSDEDESCEREEDRQDHQAPGQWSAETRVIMESPVSSEPDILAHHLLPHPGLFEIPGQQHPAARTDQPGYLGGGGINTLCASGVHSQKFKYKYKHFLRLKSTILVKTKWP